MPLEAFLFLPQMRMPMDALVAKAQAAEAAGFAGVALMDHLAPPLADDQPMWDAMTTAAWLAAHTDRVRIGHLVLCDAFRHPAVLAREAVTLDHASGGRFELGIGWGSVPTELATFGVGSPEPRHRVDRLAETLAVVRALWTGEPVDFEGRHHQLRGAQQRPTPVGRIPIVIGGVGPRTLGLVSEHADWWNLSVDKVDRVDELRSKVGGARVSIQQMVTYAPDPATSDEVLALAARRFGYMTGRVAGDTAAMVDHLRSLEARGIERVYLWFTDFADETTLTRFGAEVLPALG
ncbi:MAG TPA: LLM class flavin-dependent oxidoreductase [Acidimicrobiales bacterium]|nr:LLM class flavin-dependent oxidoreductase [Acidimicrobiales bacterium]